MNEKYINLKQAIEQIAKYNSDSNLTNILIGCDEGIIELKGDAISRDWIIAKLCLGGVLVQHGGNIQQEEILRLVREAPAISAFQPPYTEADVVTGVEWFDGKYHHVLDNHTADGEAIFVRYRAGRAGHSLSKKAVAAMLNAAVSITFPLGHPKNPEPELTLLEEFKELLRNFEGLYSSVCRHIGELPIADGAIKKAKAAITRVEGKE